MLARIGLEQFNCRTPLSLDSFRARGSYSKAHLHIPVSLPNQNVATVLGPQKPTFMQTSGEDVKRPKPLEKATKCQRSRLQIFQIQTYTRRSSTSPHGMLPGKRTKNKARHKNKTRSAKSKTAETTKCHESISGLSPRKRCVSTESHHQRCQSQNPHLCPTCSNGAEQVQNPKPKSRSRAKSSHSPKPKTGSQNREYDS